MSSEFKNLATAVAKKLGFPSCEYIASGERGTAYDVGNGKVMKITADRSEYTEASKIKGKHTVHFSDIYNIWALKNPHADIYVILKEKVDVGNAAESFIQHSKSELAQQWDKNDLYYWTDCNHPFDFFRQYGLGRVDNETLKKVREIISSISNSGLWLIDQMIGLFDEKKKYGITSNDHGGTHNIGMKNGNLAFYDVGAADNVGYEVNMDYLELENVRLEIMNSINTIQ